MGKIMETIPFKITLPVKKVYSSKIYPLMIIDANDITHYWDNNGNYDGYSHNTCIDGQTRINKN
jgi:histone acetyltransferase (RNA polymerase elongator complex component)